MTAPSRFGICRMTRGRRGERVRTGGRCRSPAAAVCRSRASWNWPAAMCSVGRGQTWAPSGAASRPMPACRGRPLQPPRLSLRSRRPVLSGCRTPTICWRCLMITRAPSRSRAASARRSWPRFPPTTARPGRYAKSWRTIPMGVTATRRFTSRKARCCSATWTSGAMVPKGRTGFASGAWVWAGCEHPTFPGRPERSLLAAINQTGIGSQGLGALRPEQRADADDHKGQVVQIEIPRRLSLTSANSGLAHRYGGLLDPLQEDQPGGGGGSIAAQVQNLAFGEGLFSLQHLFAFAHEGNLHLRTRKLFHDELAVFADGRFLGRARRHGEVHLINLEPVGPFKRQVLEFLTDLRSNRLVGLAFRRLEVVGAPKQEGFELHIRRLSVNLRAGQQHQHS